MLTDGMTRSNTTQPTEQPMVRFGEEWIPAHTAWKKLQTISLVTDFIQRFNQEFPDLASSDTREVVPLAKQRLREIELSMPARQR